MLYVKAFISGMLIPSILVPILLLIASIFSNPAVLTIKSLHFIPILWGIWNILYFSTFRNILPGTENIKIFITGAVLGLIVAGIGIHWLHLPAILGMPGFLQYMPWFGAPILYGLLWLFGVKPLNKVVGIKPDKK